MSERDVCTAVQERLTDAFFARQDAAAPDLHHTGECDACAAHRDDLLALAAGLDTVPTPELDPAVFERVRRVAADELAQSRTPIRAPLPAGYGRELARILAAPIAMLPVVLLWNWAVWVYAGELLVASVPAALAAVLGAFYAVGAGGSVGLLFGSIPFVAAGEARRRVREVTA